MKHWPVKVFKPSDAKTEKEKKLAELVLSNCPIIVICRLGADGHQAESEDILYP
jgi:hypothetical protein